MSEAYSAWTVKDCLSGSGCWCGIIVNPEGEECNRYGEISRANCWYIVHALNGKHKARGKANKTHPVPWYVASPDSEWPCIATAPELTDDVADHYVGEAYGDYNRMFVEAVNAFYGGEA